MSKKLLLSVIVATYNSEMKLESCLEAVKKQDLHYSQYEVLVIDGGSTDKTIEIAKKFNARVIHNPKKEPVWAKFLGLQKSRGKYVMYLDSDEIIVSSKSFSKKMLSFKIPEVRSVVGSGYVSPSHMPFVNEYINEFGDPFSFFIYRLSKKDTTFLLDMKKKYQYNKVDNYFIFSFDNTKQLPIIELAAMASIFDKEYLVKHYPQVLQDMSLLPHFFYLLTEKQQKLTIVKNDSLLHYSSDTLENYLKKIIWRIKNNIYHANSLGQSGFKGRETYQPQFLQLRRYLFMPYAYSLIFPLADAIILVFTRKNWKYLLHLPLTLFTATAIVYHLVLFTNGYRPEIQAYGKK